MEEGANTVEKVVIAIGVEGAGCSSFGNLLAKEELYPASCDLRSHTRESVVKQHLRFRETGLHMIYIDTIGFGRKEDLPTYVKLQRALATVGHADAIVLVISSATPRTQDLDPLLAAFDLLAQNFDVNVIDNTALIFTRWRYDQSRNSHLADETNQLVESVKNLIHTKYNLMSYLPTFFINNYAEEDCSDLQEQLAGLETFFKNMTRMELKSSATA